MAPVVVKPDTDSKRASAKLGITPEINKGTAPKIPAETHAAATKIIPPEIESLIFIFEKEKPTVIANINADGIKKTVLDRLHFYKLPFQSGV